MTSEIDSLQERVDAIRATGDVELAFRAYRALSKVLFEFTREKTGRVGPKVPIIQRVTVDDVEYLLSALQEHAETLRLRLFTPARDRNSNAAAAY
jgi:hypothetical protein